MAPSTIPAPPKKNVTRRSRKTTANLVLYSININGMNSKFDSFIRILSILSPDIITICELKTSQLSLLRVKLKEQNYKMMIQPQSGMAIVAKQKLEMVNVTACDHPNILSASFTYQDIRIRLIAVYGLQENADATERENFYDELNIEIEHCTVSDENPLISGDLNAKLGKENVGVCALSPNGKLLLEAVNKYNLKVLNFSDKCNGKWTRTRMKNDVLEESVLDYVITNNCLVSKLESITIDESKTYTPFRTSKDKQTYSDHNAIISKFTWKRNKSYEKTTTPQIGKLGWKINSEGLQMFKEKTSDTTLEAPTTYNHLESILDKTMNECFSMKKPKSNKEV